MIESWRKIEKAANVGETKNEDRNKRYDELEDAVASINLLGNAKEVAEANRFAVSLTNGEGGEVTTLLNTLRDGLRAELGLEPVAEMRLFMRMKRTLK